MNHRTFPLPGILTRLAKRPMTWAWATLLAALMICGSLTWMYYRQRQISDEFTGALTHLRQARVDLAKGYLHVVLGDFPQSPFDRNQGYALLVQAIFSLDAALASTRSLHQPADARPRYLADFERAIDRFRGQLALRRERPGKDPAWETELRVAFHDIELRADTVDMEIERDLTRLAGQYDNTFAGILWLAAALFAGICGAAVAGGRAQKRAEEEIRKLNDELEQRVLKRTAELEEANRELEAFSYSISHDLRSPLRSIDGFSLALLEEYGEQLDAAGRSYLNRVRTAAQRMGTLIDERLKLSRLAKVKIQREAVDLTEIAHSIIKYLRHADPERRVEIFIHDGVVVQGDPHLLRILMRNLLDNAWKFSKNNSKAVIEFGIVQWDGKPFCFVRDNGVGFDMAYVHKLFGEFQRLHGQDEFPGTGSGLAAVQRIINRHGGWIYAEGKPGKGATFYFRIGEIAPPAAGTPS